jgi:hypothetical protein
LNTVITLPDGKRIIITPQANPRIVKMVNNVLHKMNEKKRRYMSGKGKISKLMPGER